MSVTVRLISQQSTSTNRWDLRFSWRWRFKLRSSELWHRTVLWWDTNIPDSLHPEDGVSKVVWNVSKIKRCHNPENHDL